MTEEERIKTRDANLEFYERLARLEAYYIKERLW